MTVELLEYEPQTTLSHILSDHFEVIQGQIVELPIMGSYALEVSNILNIAISRFLDDTPLGRSRVEMLFRIPLPEDLARNRKPDVAFISFERWARNRPLSLTGNALDVVPDLAVEVISPTDYAQDVQAKAREYIRGGVRLTWQIYPALREVHAYDGSNTIRIYSGDDTLEGSTVLPGFKILLNDLFPATLPEEPKNINPSA